MPQIEHNGPGFYYLVSWRRDIAGSPWDEESVRDWRQSELLVPNTPTFVPYRIKVRYNNKSPELRPTTLFKAIKSTR